MSSSSIEKTDHRASNLAKHDFSLRSIAAEDVQAHAGLSQNDAP